MANSSWSGLTPENDKVWEDLFEKYVPSMGTADTVGGEILRAMTRILYRFYNDGDMVGVGYGNETVNSSDRYLTTVVPNYESLDNRFTEGADEAYEKVMLRNHRTVFNYLKESGENIFNLKNTFDSRQASDDDYARGRYIDEDEYDMEEDW